MRYPALAAVLPLLVAVAVAQPSGTVLTSDDIIGGFLFNRPFAVDGRDWLAVVSEGDDFALVPAVLDWMAEVDGGDSIFTLVLDRPDALLLVADVPGIRPGPVITLGRWPERVSRDVPSLTLTIGARAYSVTLEASDPALCDAVVTLREGTRSQPLYRPEEQPFACDEPHFDVVWSGDLDGDGRLDLVTAFSSKYSVHPRRLLLSSLAPPGALVGLAATFDHFAG